MRLLAFGTLMFSLFSGIVTNAQIVQKLELKNGSVLEGYIAKQRPGKDLVFKSEQATIYMSGNRVKSYSEHIVKVTELDTKEILPKIKLVPILNIIATRKVISITGTSITVLEVRSSIMSIIMDATPIMRIISSSSIASIGFPISEFT